jgi:hypothetical protein
VSRNALAVFSLVFSLPVNIGLATVVRIHQGLVLIPRPLGHELSSFVDVEASMSGGKGAGKAGREKYGKDDRWVQG